MAANVRRKLKRVFKNGTMAGVLVAIFILLLFILVATFLKSLIFGIILAYFFLPLEKFYETHFFQWRWVCAISNVLHLLFTPFSYLQNRYMTHKVLTPEEIEDKKRKKHVRKSVIASVLTVLCAILILIMTVAALLIPGSNYMSRELNDWLSSSPHVRKVETFIFSCTNPGNNAPLDKKICVIKKQSMEKKSEEQPVSQGIHSVNEFFHWARMTFRAYAESHQKEVFGILFSKGKDIFSIFFSILAWFGGFAFTILMSVVFFCFFLYQMALFMREPEQNKKIGEWCVRGIFSSGWMPRVSPATKHEAAEIIDHITFMLNCWIRGYLWIIIIEIILYSLAFSFFSVPYAPLLAIPSSLNILLPLFGIIGNLILSVSVCLLFCDGNLMSALVGLVVTYLFINGILEQLFLYPSMVGNALGLTVLETIIVVLLGGFLAGIAGMIFAVPAAAILKYLIPKIYDSFEA